MLNASERQQLEYLKKKGCPLWGGHLQRGEPISDPIMKRWVELEFIEAVGKSGYLLTQKGEQELQV